MPYYFPSVGAHSWKMSASLLAGKIFDEVIKVNFWAWGERRPNGRFVAYINTETNALIYTLVFWYVGILFE